eukprot:TRINITY_DN54770_c0_g1_i1.p1 TRINITY_DN54770_c0_g1~~TRINITY_DN54770_c0_g1_i1.p1  ORF type:complete len:606 (+),score=116.90 TRINITY_DN54770_c0_g1_i1:39-1820(+)
MGEVVGKLFINPSIAAGAIPDNGFGFFQVLFLGACYGYLLLKGSNLISDGSELLLLIPSAAGLVGSVVLPVLGAVPDGAIVLFSGMGPVEEVEQQLAVGVGALAGSTVMLITVPWFLSVLGGRVPLVRGEPLYNKKQREALIASGRAVGGGTGCFTSGVAPDSSIRASALVMLATCFIGYLVVEIPALININDDDDTDAKAVGPFAWVGMVLCGLMFIGYLVLQFILAQAPANTAEAESSRNVRFTDAEFKAVEVATKQIAEGRMNLRGVLAFFQDPNGEIGAADRDHLQARLRAVVKPFFVKYDKDRSGALSKDELQDMACDLGLRTTPEDLQALFSKIDTDGSGNIDFPECVSWLVELVVVAPQPPATSGGSQRSQQDQLNLPLVSAPNIEAVTPNISDQAEEAEEEDEGPELPDDIRDLSPAEQRRWVLKTSFTKMGLGTLIVLLISDPMVDVLNTVGERTGVPAFYIAFLLAPLASNASEMIASYAYACQKTEKSISISFAQLLGAACMNNTFCLAIFYMLVAARGLTWRFHAEVCGMLFAEIAIFLMATRKVLTLFHGALALSLMPVCLVVVYVLKATVFDGKEGAAS